MKNNSIDWTLPFEILSPNQKMHWMKSALIHKKQQQFIRMFWNKLTDKPTPPCHVKLIRIASRPFDHDNLITSFKFIKDVIADLLIPTSEKRLCKTKKGLKTIRVNMGKADADPSLTWEYDQDIRHGTKKGIRIVIIPIAQNINIC